MTRAKRKASVKPKRGESARVARGKLARRGDRCVPRMATLVRDGFWYVMKGVERREYKGGEIRIFHRRLDTEIAALIADGYRVEIVGAPGTR